MLAENVETPVTTNSSRSVCPSTSICPANVESPVTSRVAIVATPLTFVSVVSRDKIVLIPATVMLSVNEVSPTITGMVEIPVTVRFLAITSSKTISVKVEIPVTLS